MELMLDTAPRMDGSKTGYDLWKEKCKNCLKHLRLTMYTTPNKNDRT
jgi:hypothetical protein